MGVGTGRRYELGGNKNVSFVLLSFIYVAFFVYSCKEAEKEAARDALRSSECCSFSVVQTYIRVFVVLRVVKTDCKLLDKENPF